MVVSQSSFVVALSFCKGEAADFGLGAEPIRGFWRGRGRDLGRSCWRSPCVGGASIVPCWSLPVPLPGPCVCPVDDKRHQLCHPVPPSPFSLLPPGNPLGAAFPASLLPSHGSCVLLPCGRGSRCPSQFLPWFQMSLPAPSMVPGVPPSSLHGLR